MVMGRKTFDSLPGVLPGRRHIVLTRDANWSAPTAPRLRTRSKRRWRMAGGEPVSVIGGAEIFDLFLPHADRLELTEVLADVQGDTFMRRPALRGDWREVAREDHAEGETRRLPLRHARAGLARPSGPGAAQRTRGSASSGRRAPGRPAAPSCPRRRWRSPRAIVHRQPRSAGDRASNWTSITPAVAS